MLFLTICIVFGVKSYDASAEQAEYDSSTYEALNADSDSDGENNEKITPTPTTRAPYTPRVSESVVKGLEEPLAFYPGKTYSFSVIGAGTSNTDPVKGDVQWRPIYWSSYSNPTTSQRQAIGTIGHKTGIKRAATFNMYIFCQKYVYDGTQWQPTDVVESFITQFMSADLIEIATPTLIPTPTATPIPTITPTAKPDPTIPPQCVVDAAPQKPRITNKSTSYNAITISWSSVEGADGYEVYIKGKSPVYKNAGSKLSYTFKNLICGAQYEVGVRSYTNLQATRLRSEYNLLKIIPKPTTPVITRITKSSKGTAKISIKKSIGASGYEVYYSTSKNGKYIKCSTIKGNKSSFSIKLNSKQKKSKSVYYKIRSYRMIGKKKVYSSFSKYKK